ncbi:MAG: PhzF family phenazine biosynthesis protein [Erysipelotrichaceae bacterium]|nr:PhzF family phenazine biosynthesis protein [Erysipelotrichaceae bacterium]
MKQYIVDAFTNRIFAGNPAAVCLLDRDLDDATLQNIARENNLSETAFVRELPDGFSLRWFTPGGEIDLCGHATLASAFVIANFVKPEAKHIDFNTRSGLLKVSKDEDFYRMEFPAYKLEEVPVTDLMARVIGMVPEAAYLGRDLLLIVEDEKQVENLEIDLEPALGLEGLLVHVSAPSEQYDCVSRSFAPKLQVSEDPVCGSGHCHIAPYWSNVLNKSSLVAFQASRRTGVLYCDVEDNKVFLRGQAVLFGQGEIFV